MKAKSLTRILEILLFLVVLSLGTIFGYVLCQLNHIPKEMQTMIIRTANGSLMKVSEATGKRMIKEEPYNYYFEPDGCEICVKNSWTVCEVQIGTTEMHPIRICHTCYMEKGGSDEGWNDVVDAEMKKIEAKKKEKI